MKKDFIYIFILFSTISFSQIKQSIPFQDKRDEKDFNEFSQFQKVTLNFEPEQVRDTMKILYETLKEVKVLQMPLFNNQLDKNYFEWIKKKTYKVYPYYIKAIEQYYNIEDSLKKYGKNKKIRKYIKERQDELANQYEKDLKENLTIKEGQIFSRLMHRKTGKTTYEIIKELRGGWSAFWWNAKAGAVNIDLNEGFDPENVREDTFIEIIIQRGQNSGELGK